MAAGVVGHASTASGGPDSLFWRLEVGASTEYTNEVFYEDAFVDTTFLGRRLEDSPESRVAGVVWLGGRGTRDGGSARWELTNELTAGNRLQRDALAFSYRIDPSPDWRWSVGSHADFRRDRTFDRDLREWRGQVRTRVRRLFPVSFRSLEAGLAGDLLQSDGDGAELVLDRRSVTGSVGLEQSVPGGPDLWLGAATTARAFPDSAERDHWQHRLDARGRWDLPAGHVVSIEGVLDRRVTFRVVPTSRDNFVDARGAVEVEWGGADPWRLRARGDLEVQRYDVEDSTLYFDHHLVRGTLGPRLGSAFGASVWPAARLERLGARLAPGESYTEVAGIVEVEILHGDSWWGLTPAAGRREYDDDPATVAIGLPQIRTAYGFAELTVFGDQRLPMGLRVRTFVTGRLEWHEDASQDSRSLYFSLDVRKLF
jgi:hypothetical protein